MMKISRASLRENATFGRSWSASDLDQKSARIFQKNSEYFWYFHNKKTIETANMARKVNISFIYVLVNSVFSLTMGMIIKCLLTESKTSRNSVFC